MTFVSVRSWLHFVLTPVLAWGTFGAVSQRPRDVDDRHGQQDWYGNA